MTPDDSDEERLGDGIGEDDGDDPTIVDGSTDDAAGDGDGVRTQAVEEVDQRIVDLLSWILDTETRAKIYVYLLANPGSTSEEVAQGTGLYPSTVREALAELHEEERVTREKRANEGAGNNPYEYRAIQPSELVGGVVDQVQQELNTIFTLDRVLDREDEAEPDLEEDVEPVTITVDDTAPTIDGGTDESDGTGPSTETVEFDDEVDVETIDADDSDARDGSDPEPDE
ncbi:helix-turn-helix domain-containing protein [Halosolutus gelatinilyticus]|uniref:helix-turn-helix domain-containing protein n=1 Tax=Halosolutus gelatinilyticus TaxID=2931975 RepID=UPI001FF4FFBE|nr:helix-turn-helix domain-containing protein [Halosolutus gelatinilyticus]